MKAIKRNLENLLKVRDSFVELGIFVCQYYNESSVLLFSDGRSGIGSSLLGYIPSNFSYRVSFGNDGLFLTIWID